VKGQKMRKFLFIFFFLLLPLTTACSEESNLVPIKKGFYVAMMYGQKAGGPNFHEKLFQALKVHPRFQDVDLFCIAGPDPTEALGIEIDEYKERHPIPVLANSCVGAAFVIAGPFKTLNDAKSRGAAASMSLLHLYYDVIRCEDVCGDVN
jgi:hypothetical protein